MPPDDVALARARELARAGRHEDAARIAGGVAGTSAARLDLVARIRAQQGRCEEAATLWEHALELEPGSPTYRAALDRLTGGGRRRRVLRPPVAANVLLALVLGAVTVGVVLGAIDDVDGKLDEHVAAQRQPAAAAVPAGSSRTPAPARLPGSLRRAVDVRGVGVRGDRRELTITFDRGIFSRSTTISSASRRVLDRLARGLAASPNGLAVDVIGVTDTLPAGSGGPYRDNFSLGMARAAAVAEYLRARTALPYRAYRLSSRGSALPPASNATAAGRARNRSVVLAISPGRVATG